MARRRQIEIPTSDQHEQVIRYYREALAEPAVFPWVSSGWEPVRIGPTWQVDKSGHWVLPEATIGWDALGWAGTELQHSRGVPWRFTLEQARFYLWWYAVDERGLWDSSDGVLQRLKGWGKDPFGAVWMYNELLGPCRVAYMDHDRPVATDCENAWVQTAAVAQKQTKNTMRLMPGLITPEAKAFYRVDIGKQLIHAMGDERLIEAVTSSPETLEGARSTAVLRNETQHWDGTNNGDEMAAVIERNNTKSEDGTSRALAITNAPEPGMGTVAEADRDAYEAAVAGTATDIGLMYDSLEAPLNAPLTAEAAPSVVEAIRGDAIWLSPERIVKSILDVRNPPSRSRRWWYNQIWASEDAWVNPVLVDATARPLDLQDDAALKAARSEHMVMFFDGGKSDDSTGLVGCRLSDGFILTLGIWQRPTGEAGKDWRVNRWEVDQHVREILDEGNTVAFWADPSHAKDDDDQSGWWDGIIDGWHRDYGKKLKLWTILSGPNRHSVMWDMTSPDRIRQFTEAAMRFRVELGDEAPDGEELDPIFHDGHPALVQHLKFARRAPNKYGVSLSKRHRESPQKVDLAVCAVGARMLRRAFLNSGKRARSGVVI